MKSTKNLLFVILSLIFISSCANVVLKNTITNTVHVARVNDLYELGDTIFHDDVKLEIIRKKLKNGNVIRKEPYIKTNLKEVFPTTQPVKEVTKEAVKESVKETTIKEPKKP